MKTQIGKCGNSLAVLIPDNFALDLNLTEGMTLEVSRVTDGLMLQLGNEPKTLDELIAGITPENRHGETDWGPAVGKEAW